MLIEPFQEFYGTFNIGGGGILLASADAILLARHPFVEGNIGRDLRESDLFRKYLPISSHGNAEIKTFTDGVVRLNSYRRVSEYPLVVSVAFSKDDVLAPWRADMSSRLVRTGGLVLLIGTLGTWLTLQVRARQQIENAYRDTAAAFRLLAENSTDMIVRVGPDMSRLYVSPASRELLGYEPEELVGLRTDSIVHPDDRTLWEKAFGEASRDRTGDIRATYRVLRKDGATIWVEVNRRRVASGDGYVVTTRDVTRRKQAEDQLAGANRRLRLIANEDGLTGLATRRHFDEMLEAEFRRAKRNGTELSLIMIDVDRFKAFNDCYGHPAGDRCLRDIALALKNLPGRPGDLVARYGGEELVMLLPNTPEASVLMLAERARSAVRSLGIAHRGSEATIVTISLGAASLRPNHPASRADDLVQAADRALYRAKESGRDRVCLADQPEPARQSA